MLTFKDFYKLNEDASGEMAFIYSIFKSHFDKTTILVYADYIQEHNNEEELATAIRNMVNQKNYDTNDFIYSKFVEAYKNSNYHEARERDGIVILFPRKYYIPSLEKCYMYDKNTGDWGVLQNITSSSILENEINVNDFKHIPIEKVPQPIVQLAFWDYLYHKN